MKLRTLDLFAGIGGFSLGLERTGGFETVAFCEIDKAAQKVLKKHWPNVPIFEDIKSLSAKEIDGPIDVITGGFPCQDISVAGKGAGLAGARSGLWWEYHRLIQETQPKWIIAENVSALRSRGLDEVLRSLAEIGYDAEWHCIPASAVGAPHRRDRIWIVAYPSGGQRISGAEEQRVLRALSEDGAINNHSSGRSEAHTFPLAHPDSGMEANGGERQDASGEGHGRRTGPRGSGADDRQGCIRGSGQGSQDDLAHPSGTGLQGGKRLRDHLEEVIRGWKTTPRPTSQRCPISGGTLYSWDVEPNVGRVANGVSGRMDRLKQLGNAVVPQIPELIGKAILQAS